jgi:IS5 family transposase
LTRVDALLDDERFFAPFRAYFDTTFGRPSIPVETYLRLMFLKVRYRLGYESLCADVTDSIGWRLFCRIGGVLRIRVVAVSAFNAGSVQSREVGATSRTITQLPWPLGRS